VRTANAMAFDLFLALVPMLGLAGWAASLVVLSEEGKPTGLQFLHRLSPTEVEELIGKHFEALAAAHLAPIAALVGWWLASSAFDTMMGVFEETFDCVPRPWWLTRAISLGLALLGMSILGFGSTLGVMTALALTQNFGIGAEPGPLLNLLVGTVTLGIASSFLALSCRYSIRRPGVRRRIWPGAFVATLLGAIASIGLGFYATNLASYTLFYGGLAAIVVVLFWLWLLSTAILLGAELNIAMEDVRHARQTLYGVTGAPATDPTQTPRPTGNPEGA
jgi:membrane protein